VVKNKTEKGGERMVYGRGEKGIQFQLTAFEEKKQKGNEGLVPEEGRLNGSNLGERFFEYPKNQGKTSRKGEEGI